VYGAPPPVYGAPPAAPQAYELGGSVRPPRPDVRLGAGLMILGAVLTIVGSVLPWLKIQGKNGNGFDDYISNSNGELKILKGPGKIWIFFAIVVIGLGIGLFLAGRVLAVAILGIVFSAVGAFFVLGSFGVASDTKDYSGEGSYQIGLYIGMIAMLMALAGSIIATSKRRR
jgi:hypothetical protein